MCVHRELKSGGVVQACRSVQCDRGIGNDRAK